MGRSILVGAGRSERYLLMVSNGRASVAALMCAFVLSACGAGGGDVAVGSGAVTDGSNETTAVESPLPEARITDAVHTVAAGLGDDDPQDVHWVFASDFNTTSRLIYGSDVGLAGGGDNVPVVLVSARGRFTMAVPSKPDASNVPSGPWSMLYLRLDASTGEVIGVDATDDIVDLTEVGEVTRPT